MPQRIDLSNLPFPDAIAPLDFESIVSDLKTSLIAIDASLAAALSLESEPMVKLLQAMAYRELHLRANTNHTVKRMLLAYANKADLDHLAAGQNIARLLITPANLDAIPPIAALFEPDDDLRRRIQLSFDRPAAGSISAYQSAALSAHADVADAYPLSPAPGVVHIMVLSRSEMIAPSSLLQTVDTALDPLTIRPLTDKVSVLAANPVSFVLDAQLTLFPGPSADVVLAAAIDSTNKYIAKVRAIGYDVTISGLHQALHQAGVQRVHLNSPAQDILVDRTQYPHCSSMTIRAVEFRDV